MTTPTTPKFTHAQDGGKVVLALWLFAAPWMLGYHQATLVLWNDYAVAIVVALSSVAAMLRFSKWDEYASIVAGFWLFAAPWLLDFSSLLDPPAAFRAIANHLAVGLALVIFSLWELNVWEFATRKLPKP